MSEATMLNVLITSRELPPRTRNRPDDRFQQMEVGTIAATLSPSALARLRDLEELYRARWQELPTFACRAPGRVNLIGEHIDYHRFSVLPVAIEGDVCNACTRACGPRLPRR